MEILIKGSKPILILFLLMIQMQLFGQITIKGKVTSSEDHQALPGVSVIIKNTTTGTITNADGSFSIAANSAKDILVYRFIGYQEQQVVIGDKTEINIVMEPEVKALQEVVVMGYSDKKRGEITSAITTVSAEKLNDVTSNNIGTMLQGKVAGIQVVNSSGAPGAQPDIRIRGVASMNAPQGPLFVIDGIIGGTFDPNDVESITVLKDAGATGMYGAQANGGVIVVTTKKSKSEVPVFDVKVVSGMRIADHGHVKMMDSKTLYNYQREYFRDPVLFAIDDRKFKAVRPDSITNINTDWLKECFKTAYLRNYYVSSSAKIGKFSYYIGASYYDEEGTFINTYFKKLNLRANTTYSFSDRVTLTNNINLSGSKDRQADYMSIYYAYTSMPWDNPYDSNGNIRSFKGATGVIWSKDKINPLQAANNTELTNKGFNLDYDLDLNIKISNWLTFTTTNRLSANTLLNSSFYSKLADNLSYYGTGYINQRNDFNCSGITTDLLKFKFENVIHSFSGLVGFEAANSYNQYLIGSGTNLPEGLQVPSVASAQNSIKGTYESSPMQSFISQANYSYKSKYFLSGSYRIDQVSSFPKAKRTAKFPSLSAGWLISSEDFMKSQQLITNLKLKASWGLTGMKDMGPDMYLDKFAFTTQFDGQPAAIPIQKANPNLSWEQTSQVNFGIEFTLGKRVNIDVNVYDNTTDHLLVLRSLPPSGGFKNQWQNTGQAINKGVEIAISSTNIQTASFTWTTDFSVGYNKNELQGFGSDTIFNTNAYGISQIYHNGGQLYTWYAKEYYGIDPANGSMLWVDKNGETTHEYKDARIVEQGTPIPKIQGGFSTEFKYKNLSLRGNFSYVYKNKIYNYFRRYVDSDLQDVGFNAMMPRSDSKTWQKPGDIADHPLPQNARNSYDPSTRFIVDGSYLKIRNITVAYELPLALVSKLKLRNMSLALSADNVYTFTNFWGQDPEVSVNPQTGMLPGYAEFKYPNNKQYVLSLNVRF